MKGWGGGDFNSPGAHDGGYLNPCDRQGNNIGDMFSGNKEQGGGWSPSPPESDFTSVRAHTGDGPD